MPVAGTCIQALGACSDTARVRTEDRSLHTSRPEEAQCPERLDIHLRVDARGVMALVSQQLADLRQGRAGSEKLGGKAMSEDMGSLVCVAANAGALQGCLGDHRDRAPGCKAEVGCRCAQKQPAARRRRAA